MENILANFDLESKEIIKELSIRDKKFNQLINRLQIARDSIECEIKISTLTHKSKK